MSFELYLIRHGESANNAAPEPQRTEDPGLTERGQRQAEAVAMRFADVPLTHVLCSAFLRAILTTQPLSRAVSLRPSIWTDLHEVGGCYAGHLPGQEVGRPGMDRQTLSQQFPEFDLPADIDELGWWKSRPYESWDDARGRAQRQAARLIQTFAGTHAQVACVIHADFKSLLLEELVADRAHAFSPSQMSNCGVSYLSYSEASFQLHDFNSIDHLP